MALERTSRAEKHFFVTTTTTTTTMSRWTVDNILEPFIAVRFCQLKEQTLYPIFLRNPLASYYFSTDSKSHRTARLCRVWQEKGFTASRKDYPSQVFGPPKEGWFSLVGYWWKGDPLFDYHVLKCACVHTHWNEFYKNSLGSGYEQAPSFEMLHIKKNGIKYCLNQNCVFAECIKCGTSRSAYVCSSDCIHYLCVERFQHCVETLPWQDALMGEKKLFYCFNKPMVGENKCLEHFLYHRNDPDDMEGNFTKGSATIHFIKDNTVEGRPSVTVFDNSADCELHYESNKPVEMNAVDVTEWW